ncbi:hypothetical protein EJ05DRAFT_495987 [Pseudovirgaria hyperparasitica]|uniref:SH3 domain-containing protein n=1 Tax=Pseudovirgaria hyperparasitica TaxID=470096 RepID=A0A6A6WLT1_9PEZI|nr:uncharacterized protein EJ05DRAFT_495987 [Pseudovirgaria hyperparasitica]KAF2763155.1 hypothetical protein EJ05DRAFT_495987 [Pseudovirgaria hyperparasitica]
MFRVKALYDYASPHDDDLSFPAGQIITVTEEEDDDWYIGEYKEDSTGAKKEGLFPKNFVEKYEPEPPPRPNRASRHKPLDAVATQALPPVSAPLSEAEEPIQERRVEPATVRQAEISKAAPEEPAKTNPPPKPAPEPSPAPKPVPNTSISKAPPPVAEKSSSFKDRIAAFNKPAAAPVAPFKPSGSKAGAGFVKKPFVAPPPSRNAYVPTAPREPPPQKVYRREEDPEIAERQAQDLEAAEKAGLAATTEEAQGDDAPKPTSLKERIALLQKQQAEQAKRAEATQKDKPKRPSKKRTESEIQDAAADENNELDKVASPDGSNRGSIDVPRTAPPRKISHGLNVSEIPQPARELLSDTNDADQSAAGETTEEAEGESTSVDDNEDTSRRIPQTPLSTVHTHKDIEEEDEGASEEEDDEIDAETRRKLELRERMAKMSGGMGMAGMFGGGLPSGGIPPKKKKTAPVPEQSAPDDYERAPRLPMIPIPGMSTVRSPESEDTQLNVVKEDQSRKSAVSNREPEDVPDIEDVEPASPSAQRGAPPPIPSQRPVSMSERVAPPVPTERPVPPAPVPFRSPTSGSESDDEMPRRSIELSARGPPPPVPASDHSGPRSPSVPRRTSTMGSDYVTTGGTSSPAEKRSSRIPPPVPVMSPPMSPPAQARPPPPPPPTAAPPSRQPTIDSISQRVSIDDELEEETEYEGDYDTDIASGATHKEALGSHVRESSIDDSTTADEGPIRSPILPPAAPPPVPSAARAIPPLPPQQAPAGRQSTDAPRGAPPPLPPPARAPPGEDDNDHDYDPYKYTAEGPRTSGRPTVPPPVPVQAAPPQPTPTIEIPQADSDDELYASPPPPPARQSTERAVPPTSHGPPQQLPHYEPAGPSSSARKSLDVNRAAVTYGRKSTDLTSPKDQGFIAQDIDLAVTSLWWTQLQMPPPAFQGRKDVLFEVEESTSSKRGGRATVSRDVYIIFQDYSQTIVTARFDAQDPADVVLEQRHEAPPARLRQDQLEDAHSQFGQTIYDSVQSKQNSVVGDGTPHGLVQELLKPMKSALPPVGSRAYGALVYANLANATVQQHDEIRPGDVITFRNAKFEGKHGPMHAKYKMDLGKEHVGIVAEWDGTKKKVRAWEQGRESRKCKVESFRVGDLRSGEVRVWRIMGRSWVGWDDGK